MTSLEPTASHEVRFVRIEPQARREALSLLLTGRTHHADGPVDNFLHYTTRQNLDLSNLWAAQAGDHLLAACLIVPSPGRTSMIFLSPIRDHGGLEVTGKLISATVGGIDRQQVRLVQALLDPGQHFETKALIDAGFTSLAELIYMQRRTERGDVSLHLPEGVEAVTWSPQARPLFTEAILSSYEQTRDCPGLVGLREIDDIIAGHMAAGVFEPDLWLALHHGDEPAGVMLLNRMTHDASVELVYLGLTPRWRGHGLGRMLVTRGLAQAHARGLRNMLLAVDSANAPAKRLYESLRFSAHARKRALIFALS